MPLKKLTAVALEDPYTQCVGSLLVNPQQVVAIETAKACICCGKNRGDTTSFIHLRGQHTVRTLGSAEDIAVVLGLAE